MNQRDKSMNNIYNKPQTATQPNPHQHKMKHRNNKLLPTQAITQATKQTTQHNAQNELTTNNTNTKPPTNK